MSSVKPLANFHQISNRVFCQVVLTICSNSFALMNKMAAMPIYGKNTDFFSPGPRSKVYQVCSNDDPRMTFDFLRHCQIS